ncbi:hypothetical protein HDR60_04880 [bacterium]|nr:hypothetical protein [bacterium]
MLINESLYSKYLKERYHLRKSQIYSYLNEDIERILLITSSFDDDYINKIITIIKDISKEYKSIFHLIKYFSVEARYSHITLREDFEQKYEKILGVSLLGTFESIIISIFIIASFEIENKYDIEKEIYTNSEAYAYIILLAKLESILIYTGFRSVIKEDTKQIITKNNRNNGAKKGVSKFRKFKKTYLANPNGYFPKDCTKYISQLDYIMLKEKVSINTAKSYYRKVIKK